MSAVERSTGSSASANGRAPSIPRSARSPYRYAAVAASSEQNANRSRRVTPPTSQPTPANAAASRRPEPGLQEVQRDAHAARTPTASSSVSSSILEPARRPVGLGGVAAARAVQRRDVLERDEDVAVELDVGNVLDRAVRGEHSLLVLAAEERDLDLLALVLVRVVLHERVSLLAASSPSRTASRTTWQFADPCRPPSSSQCREHGSHRAAVGDDENARAAGCSRDRSRGRPRPRARQLLGRLAVAPAASRARLGSASATSASVSPSHVPKCFSRSCGHGRTGSARGSGDDRRRLARTREVARVHRRERLIGELARPARCACSRPVSLSGASVCPWTRRSRFQSVSP